MPWGDLQAEQAGGSRGSACHQQPVGKSAQQACRGAAAQTAHLAQLPSPAQLHNLHPAPASHILRAAVVHMAIEEARASVSMFFLEALHDESPRLAEEAICQKKCFRGKVWLGPDWIAPQLVSSQRYLLPSKAALLSGNMLSLAAVCLLEAVSHFHTSFGPGSFLPSMLHAASK